MGKVEERIREEVHYDAGGNVTKESISTMTVRVEKLSEGDFVKLYTKAWKRYASRISTNGRVLFMELISRMSYCESDDFPNSQLVKTGEPFGSQIRSALGWASCDNMQRGAEGTLRMRSHP